MRALSLLILTASLPGPSLAATDAEVREVHRSALLIDTHNDVPGRTAAGFDIGPRASTGHTDLARLREGGVGAVFFSVYVAAGYVQDNRSANRALQMIDTVRHDIVARYPNDFAFALTAADIETAHRQGKIAALMGLEGGHAIEDSLRLLRDYFRLGIRYMTLTHSNTNNWADSSGDIDKPGVQHHNGLTAAGKDVVREMNRLGMIVDISHVSDKTFWDVLEVSQAPVFASHSSCRAFCDAPRDMTDEMIVALAKKGGVIQINFECSFLTQAARDAWVAKKPQPRATLDDVVRHIDHVVQIAGIDAVGIGSDFDGVDCVPTGLDDVSKFPNLTRALLEKGYKPDQIRKIYGGNTLKLMRAVERLAAPTPSR
jgi:membrane dipeptidase